MRAARKSATGKQRPLDVRPCETCGEDIFFALRAPIGGSWRALNAAPVTDDRKAFALVLIGHQAWRRVDLLEHYLVTREVTEEKARELADTYPHHLLHTHLNDEGNDPS